MPLLLPITGGSPSGDVAVVALAYDDVLLCSGTVIAPHAVLTAAHCLTGTKLPDVAIGDTLATAMRHPALAAFVHPDFDAQTFDHDIAVLIVDPPLDVPALPTAFAPIGIAAGATIRVVGYGLTVAGDTLPPTRRTGTSQVDVVDELRIISHAAPSQACEGDSGGPALFDAGDGERVIGVASSGDAACTQVSRHTRVDVHQEFVSGVVTASAPGAAAAGDRCWYDANCSVGACLPAVDEPRWSFCAPACGASDCPGDLECVTIDGDARCRNRLPSPGAEGASCVHDDDCAGALCLAPAGDRDAVCTSRCFSDLPGFTCPSGETCRDAADGGEACFAPDDGGCASTRGQGFLLALLSLAFVAQVLRGRGMP